ncbi:Calcium-transporting ATPase [Melia azedarach]|uniref:Calcium-transporting ATPase n=1 Tax=Melia azedarach TaxID=155640 RepID=A0ACC1Z365_MELAZ|nr:Calcium-transporting ATPase [Melia azedarach]
MAILLVLVCSSPPPPPPPLPQENMARLWRRTITVGVIVSLKIKKTTYYQDLSPSPLLTRENENDSNSNSQQQESSNNDSPVHENRFISLVSRAYNSFSSKSFEDEGTPSSSYDPVPPSPVEHALGRNLSAQSRHAIDMPSDNEEEEVKSEEEKLRDTAARIVKEKDLNSLREFGGIVKVAATFGSDLVKGKEGFQDPQIWDTKREIQAKGFFYFLLKAGNNISICLLLVAASLSFVTGIMEQGAKDGWHDGVAILAAVFMLLIFPAVANSRRARKVEENLSKEKNQLGVKVVRNELPVSITISSLVEGDIVRLTKGDRVPADGLVVDNDGLVLDDVLNSKIDGERNPFLFSVGANTALGNMLKLMIQDPDGKTLLEAQTEKPNSYIENLSLFVSVLIALVAFIRFICRKHSGDDNELPDLKGNVTVGMVLKIVERILIKPQGKISILVSALTVVVIAIQHGMPFVVTISLSFWNEKLAKIQAKPQNLSACATMGIVSVFYIDATGGLVCNQVEVKEFWIGEKDVSNDADFEIDQVVLQALERGIGASILVPEIFVSPTKDWLISLANSRSLNLEFVDRNLSILEYRKLSSSKNVCGFLVKNKNVDEGKLLHMHWSGAASTILQMCSHYYDCKGESHAIGDEKRKFEKLIKEMEGSGLRPIAFACSKTEVQEIKEDGLHLLALAGLRYPCPEEIISTVEALRNAGVRIILVTEDELSAARAIACQLGIFRPESNDVALEGEEFRDLDSNRRKEILDKMTLMGSCLAEHKLLLVQSTQQKGDVVAFFGGSLTGDTPALKEADVAITLKDRCTETASASSDIIISANGSLSLIVEFGRCAYKNVQKFIQLQLTACISGLLITLVTTLVLEESPITTVQLIWINWIVCILGGFMMRIEFKDRDTITNKRTKSLLNKVIWKHIAIQVLCQAFVLLIFQFKGQVIPSTNKDIQKTMIFSSFTLCQVFSQFNTMRLVKKEVLSVVLRNYTFLLALAIVILMQVLVVEFAKSLASYQKLNGMQWGVCFILAAVPWGIHCAANFISDSLLKPRL